MNNAGVGTGRMNQIESMHIARGGSTPLARFKAHNLNWAAGERRHERTGAMGKGADQVEFAQRLGPMPAPHCETWPWRLLTRADTIQRGDQGLNDDCETWHEVVPFVCGMRYTPGFFVPIRRAMTGCTTPDTCRGRDGCSGACKTPNAAITGAGTASGG